MKKRKVPSVPKKYFTVDPPEGIRVFMPNSFSTDVVPKGHTLEYCNVHSATPPSKKKAIPFVLFHHVERDRGVRLPYREAEKMQQDGVLRE